MSYSPSSLSAIKQYGKYNKQSYYAKKPDVVINNNYQKYGSQQPRFIRSYFNNNK